jgi:hypothetical protein
MSHRESDDEVGTKLLILRWERQNALSEDRWSGAIARDHPPVRPSATVSAVLLKVCVRFTRSLPGGNAEGEVLTAYPTNRIHPDEEAKWPIECE